ncbi:essential MCU regulator, mitochondrial [Condylostylus longicornis]|uniref:essential MCU regulator, mitochondrial n=1 Tax=Condylostylus longicornis TaxID=2530218 RepID=UPI00244E290A|nr:essential MCU regulator, mitochondrial [Condylostylus longicornis]
MISSKIAQLSLIKNFLVAENSTCLLQKRLKTHFRSGALKPKPDRMPFGIVSVVCAVVPGLFIGAAISKSVANFLEENDLFVPSEDDDED